MKFIKIIRGNVKTFESERLPGSVIWPLFEDSNKKLVCLDYLNKAKDLRCDISCLKEKTSDGRYSSILDNYWVWCTALICDLSELRKRRTILMKSSITVQKINSFTILHHLFDKLLWKIATECTYIPKPPQIVNHH